jgi:hypothetical protein
MRKSFSTGTLLFSSWTEHVIVYSNYFKHITVSCTTLQIHFTENSKQIIPEMKLRGLVHNFYIHVSVSNLCIPMIGPQMQYRKIGGPIVGIYKWLTDSWM